MFFRWRKETQQAAPSGSTEREQLLFDEASGVYQGWYFERRVEEEVVRCGRYGRPFAVAVWEPRLLPDEEPPDEAIARAGQVIKGGIREFDLAGRLGRTRFAALLIEASDEIGRSVSHRLKSELGQRARTGTGPWRAGFAMFPDDGLKFDVLLQVASRRQNEDVSAAAA